MSSLTAGGHCPGRGEFRRIHHLHPAPHKEAAPRLEDGLFIVPRHGSGAGEGFSLGAWGECSTEKIVQGEGDGNRAGGDGPAAARRFKYINLERHRAIIGHIIPS